MLDTGYRMLDAGCWIQVAGRRSQVAGRRSHRNCRLDSCDVKLFLQLSWVFQWAL